MTAIIHLVDRQVVTVKELLEVKKHAGGINPTSTNVDDIESFDVNNAAQYTFIGVSTTVAFAGDTIQFVEFKK